MAKQVKKKDCGCKDKKKLQSLFYRVKPRCLTESEYKEWTAFKKVRKLPFTKEQIDFLCKLYSSVMNRQYYKPPTNNYKPLIKMSDDLDKVYELYQK